MPLTTPNVGAMDIQAPPAPRRHSQPAPCQRSPGGQSSRGVSAHDDENSAPEPAHSPAALRVELARKDAEIEYLHGALAEATAVSGSAQDVPELLNSAAAVKSELQLVKQEMAELRGNTAR